MALSRRDVVRSVYEGNRPLYVPWSFGFTTEAAEKLVSYYGSNDLQSFLDNHIIGLGNENLFENLSNGRVRDNFGVVWDRSIDKDIGVIEGISLTPIFAGRVNR